jgi:hypothetical protein
LFASLQVFQPESEDICGQITKLAESVMCVTVESANQAPKVCLSGSLSKGAVPEGSHKVTSDIIATAKIFP